MTEVMCWKVMRKALLEVFEVEADVAGLSADAVSEAKVEYANKLDAHREELCPITCGGFELAESLAEEVLDHFGSS